MATEMAGRDGVTELGGLSPHRVNLLRAVAQFWAEHGYSPTLADLAEATGMRSRSGIYYHVSALRRQGLISPDSSILALSGAAAALSVPASTSDVDGLPSIEEAERQQWSFRERLLLTVATFHRQHGRNATFRGVAEHLGISFSTTAKRIAIERRMGYLCDPEPGRPRALALTDKGWECLRRAPAESGMTMPGRFSEPAGQSRGGEVSPRRR